MIYFDYDESDELVAALRDCKRMDLDKWLPLAGTRITESAGEFWADVLARFHRGEWQDAVTAIERRFEPRWTKGTDAMDIVVARRVGRRRRIAA